MGNWKPHCFIYFSKLESFLFSVQLFSYYFAIIWWIINKMKESGERVLLRHCFTAGCGARQCLTQWEQERGWQTTVFKGHLEFRGLWSFVVAMGGGNLFFGGGELNLQCKQTQVSGGRAPWSLHHENHLNGQRGGRGGAELGLKGEVWPLCYGNSFGDTVTCYLHTSDFIYPPPCRS